MIALLKVAPLILVCSAAPMMIMTGGHNQSMPSSKIALNGPIPMVMAMETIPRD